MSGRGLALVLLVVLIAGAGCASRPAAGRAPIADVGALVGRWEGTTSPDDHPFSLTINPGGTLVGIAPFVRPWQRPSARLLISPA